MNTHLVVFSVIANIISVVLCNNELNKFLFSGNYEFIDLTHPFDNQTVYWSNTQPFIFTKQTAEFSENGNWYAANEFAADEHGGTHIDAPFHFILKGKHVGELPIDRLILPLIVIDVSSKVNDDPNFVLHKKDLDYMINDNFGQPCVVLFKFGWSKYFNNRSQYLGINKITGAFNFPGPSEEVIQWITSSYKNVYGIGVDTASVDVGSSKDFPVHQMTAKNGLYNLENVNLSEPIPDYGCTLLVLPMKIAEGTGAPARLIAICPKKEALHF